ncbi:MAG: MlaD family protein [Ancalomicrobiaceae bacterium]|nr:MlaD family protein [Ancalomicrobiaceae bacterium]
METRANLVTVGLFVLAVIIAGFTGAYWLLKGNQSGPRATVAVIFTGSVGGLVPGAAVGFNGIKIGEVSKVGFAPNDPAHVVAYLNVDANAPVKTDSRAALTFSGLTGYASVQITGGSAGSPRLLDQKGGIPQLNADASSVQDLMQGAKQIMGRADETLTSVQRLIEENGPSLTKTIKNAETFSDSLAKNSDSIDKFMASVGQAADVLTKVSGRAETLVTDLDHIVTGVDRDKVAKILDDVSRVSGNLADSSQKISATVEQAQSSLKNVDTLTSNLNSAVDEARKVIGAVETAKVASTIDDVSKLSHYLSGKTQDFDAFLASAKSAAGHIDTITADLSTKSTDIASLIDETRSAVKNVDQLSSNLNGGVSEARKLIGAVEPDKVAATVDNVSKFSAYLTGKTQDFDDLVTHAKSAATSIDAFSGELAKKSGDVNSIIDDSKSAMHQIEVASHRIDGILANVDGLVSSDEGKGLFKQGSSFLTEATEAAKAFKEMSQAFTAKSGEISAALNQFTSQGLREVKDFVADSRRTMSTIDRTVTDFNRNPQQLIFGNNRGNVPEYGPGRR